MSSTTLYEQTYRAMVLDREIAEMRALGVRGKGTFPEVFTGYYDNPKAFARDVLMLEAMSPSGIYMTLNPVNPQLLARRANRCERVMKGGATGEGDIVRRVWILLDFDPVRPSGISATDQERDSAWARARDCKGWLIGQGVPDGALWLGGSGNGAHLNVAVDIACDVDGDDLVARVVAFVALHYSDQVVLVDTQVTKRAQLVKVYGTTVRKGDNLPLRPHRRSELLEVPSTREITPRAVLEAIAANVPTSPAAARSPGHATDVSGWLATKNVAAQGPTAWQGGGLWTLSQCVWNPAHTNRSSFIVQFPSGAVAAGCHHASCSGKGWAEMRDAVEPGWRATGPQGVHGGHGHLAPAVRLLDVTTTAVSWLWKPYFPLNTVTLAFGDPGIGKGLCLSHLAASVSTGSAMGGAKVPAGDVLWFCAEDDPGQVIRPRAAAHGGDLSRIHVVGEAFALDADGLRQIEAHIQMIHPSVLFLDPFTAYAGAGVNLNRATHTRPIFAKLTELAARHRVTVVVVHHTNKSEGDALRRASGSFDLIAASRSVLVFGAPRADRANRAMFHIKSNLAETGPALGFRVSNGTLTWTGPSTLTPEAVFGPQRDAPNLDEAVEFLKTALAHGPVPAAEISEQAAALSISKATLRRALEKLSVKRLPIRDSAGRVLHWVYSL